MKINTDDTNYKIEIDKNNDNNKKTKISKRRNWRIFYKQAYCKK